ncbi:M14 family zinc carboxypeptidase [Umezawaea endophytica]|uniref:M14 family zinc carboxypeptidase n=1 Tax=Umezawaea endophytica TaxID=1654476 RepID=A0A9X3ADZ5_9PSEU|nr:M14 family zinc carboxypeptidase [Umezawaea endophytica]MCS7476251.1 M14 family zinc carboxypeptidase [Umezawaea endophytica]
MKGTRSRLALLCAAAVLVTTGTATAAPDDRTGFTTTADTYYGGYRTVSAHEQHLDQVAREHPDLATVVDYGDSWLKTQNRGGHDLRALCVTRRQPGDCALSPNTTKPRFFVMGQLHSRELTTGEIAWRWIDHLVGSTAPEIATLLDTTEFWIVPIANPDGVDNVQRGGDTPIPHRKNGNDTNLQGTTCGALSYDHHGVDLNRNTSSNWGLQNASERQCDQDYRGPAADSEPETRALEGLWRSLYRDRRATDPAQPAPTDTAGVVLSLHSYGNYSLFPWSGGATTRRVGNDAALRDLAQDFAELAGPGWKYGQAGQVLYSASGTTEDWVYDELGVASFVWEMGSAPEETCGGFFPAYSCQSGTFWPKALPMLMHAARNTAAPYSPVPEPTTPCATQVNDTDTPVVSRVPVTVTVGITVTACQGNARSASVVDVRFKNMTVTPIITLDLVAPDGTSYHLQERVVGTVPDNTYSFTLDLSRESRAGTWKLQVYNVMWLGTGDLDRWSLTM